MERRETTFSFQPRSPEEIRIQRLREDAKRPISVNLAETIALSHELIRMADAARRR
jgi:hypothetical protein